MQSWVSFLVALLELGLRLLEKLDAARADEFRRRIASDGAGVLIRQLNPTGAGASGADESAAAGAGGDGGSVDEQR